ncbi:MAG: hypothetical protein ACYSRZ_05910 [Planctomycetota bacterium]|jgi:hypothetical protein
MATPQKGEPSRIIGSISRFAGTLVGTVVFAGKCIVGAGNAPIVAKLKAPVKPPKKAASKPVGKGPKKKKKVVKQKSRGSSGKRGTSKKKAAQSPAKKKKGATSRKKATRRKTNKVVKTKASSHSQNGLTSKFSSSPRFVNV